MEPGTPSGPRPSSGPRRVLLHYHLFKNAGTSLDAILQRSFGDSWTGQEFGPVRDGQEDALRHVLAERPNAKALSSHTLLLPVPRIEGFEFFPVIFVRHPLARLKSAYEFERTQNAETRGARLAKTTDFAGYLKARLDTPNDRACRDFQSYRLAMACPASGGSEIERALRAVEILPFVGLVEEFDKSVQRLQRAVEPIFPEFQFFSVRRNVTSAHGQGGTDLAAIEEDLGEAFYKTVLDANVGDLALHSKVLALLAGDSTG